MLRLSLTLEEKTLTWTLKPALSPQSVLSTMASNHNLSTQPDILTHPHTHTTGIVPSVGLTCISSCLHCRALSVWDRTDSMEDRSWLRTLSEETPRDRQLLLLRTLDWRQNTKISPQAFTVGDQWCCCWEKRGRSLCFYRSAAFTA